MSADLLQRLLVAWRATRSPAVEAAIVRVGGELARARGPIVAPDGELEATWKAIAALRDPCDVDRLLEAEWPAAWLVARPRVELLEGFLPDPRVAAGLVRVAKRYPTTKARPFHELVARLLEQTPSPSLVPALQEIRVRTREVYAHLPALASRIEVRPADPALLAEAARRPDSETVAALAAAHAAEPADLALRGVLADALIAAGDPRGELIALQTAIAEGRGGLDAARRASALLEIHGHAWLAGFPADVGSCRFERGFVVAARTSTYRTDFATASGRPEWETIEQLEVSGSDRAIGPLLRHLPRLRVLVLRTSGYPSHAAPVIEGGPFPSVRALGLGVSQLPTDLRMFPSTAVLAGQWRTPGDVLVFGRSLQLDLQRRAAALGIHAIVHASLPASELRALILERAAGPPETRFSVAPWDGFTARRWTVWVAREAPRFPGRAGRPPEVRIAWTGPVDDQLEPDLGTILDACATTGITAVRASIAPADRAVIEPLIARKLTDIARRVARGKRLVAIELDYDAAPVDLASPHWSVSEMS